MNEHEEQAMFVEYVKLRGFPIAAVPNGFHISGSNKQKTVQAVNKLRAEGMSNGFPDLIIPYPTKHFHGLFIEMKRADGGTVSDEQKQWLDLLNNLGYLAVACHGFDKAKKVFDDYIRGEKDG